MTTNQIAYQNMMEKVRNDQAIENETNRHNKAIEDYNSGVLSDRVFQTQEVARHNRVMEQLQSYATAIEARRNELTARYNELNLHLGASRASEEARHNQALEQISALQEQHNYLLGVRNANITERKAEYQHSENLIQLGETTRHNTVSEITNAAGLGINLVNNIISTMGKAGIFAIG